MPRTVPDPSTPALAEEQVRLEQEFSDALMAAVDALVVVLDPDGRIVRFNRASEEVSGYRAEDVLGTHLWDILIPPEDGRSIRERFGKLQPSSFPGRVTQAWIRRDGKRRRIAWSYACVLDGEGRVGRIIGTGIDITDGQRADASMRAVEDVGRLLATAGPTAAALDAVLSMLGDRFGYRLTSIYLWNGEELWLGAARGYDRPDATFRADLGVMGRVIRTRCTAFVPDVSLDADHVSDADGVVREICVPLIVEGDLLGVLNVEEGADRDPLDERDVRLIEAIGDRVATAIALGRDRQELAQRAQALAASEEHARLIIDTASDAFVGIDAVGRVVDWNLQAEELFGWRREEVIGRTISETIVPFHQRRKHEAALARFQDPSLGHGFRRRAELTALHRSGRTFPVEMTIWAVGSGPTIRFNALIQEISERKQLEDELRFQAFHDPLTRLPNRALLIDRLEQALARVRRRPGKVAVLFLDVDDFKVINDTLGHRSGDALLVEVGRRLVDGVRPGDTAARLGGDEFTVLLEDVPDASLAISVAERIADRMSAPIMLDGRELTVTTSIGIAVTDGLDATSEDVVAQADVALYAAKDRGKAQYQLFEPPMRERAWTRFELETDLRLAMDRGQLSVHYQPVIDLRGGHVRSIEALVRWQHPERGMIAPSTFIPLAERAGIIGQLGNRVLEDACRQIRDWQSRFPSEQPLSVSVNVSARQIHDGTFADRVATILAETGLAPAHLKLELTESTMMLDTDATDSTLGHLADLGVGILVDDFGTGFSALHYFKRLRLQGLKIDRSFVHGLGRSRSDTAIISAAIAFARALDLTVTAEGIENDEQLRRLRELGCDLGQGFHLVRPLSADLLEGLLREMPRTSRRARDGNGRLQLERSAFAAT